jgi:glycosyltransferase involved in cell wall biosynthesis
VAQTCAGVELIVIDGGSTDGTLELLKHYGDSIVSSVSEPDRNIYEALNKGLARARGEWIYVIGADDYLWSPDVLERMLPHLRRARSTARVVYGQVALLNERGETVLIAGGPWDAAKKGFRSQMSIPHQGVFHHRSLFAVHGQFNETFRVAGDYEMLLRELKSRDAVFVPGVVVAGYRFGGGSSRPENMLRVLFEWRRGQKLNGIAWPTPRWIAAVAAAYARLTLSGVLGDRTTAVVFDFVRGLLRKPPYWTRI